MATEGLKISQMAEKSTIDGTEYIPIVEGTTNKKVKVGTITKPIDEKLTELTERFTETDNNISKISVTVDGLTETVEVISDQIGHIGSTLDEINAEEL